MYTGTFLTMNNENKIIVLGSDHNGVRVKELLCESLRLQGYLPLDIGPYDSDVTVDYTSYARQVSYIIENNRNLRGILICGTGAGMSIAANRFAGVRAVLVHNEETAIKCREHNDSNVLCLGSWVNDFAINERITMTWLNEPFGEGRHNKRVAHLLKGFPRTKNIVFTNGVFDILHTGHVELLQYARELGDKLVVAINSDTSVRTLKGPTRPVNSEVDRKTVLESMREVDEVIIFDGNLEEIREKIAPNIVVKGGEWTADAVRHRDNIPDDIEVKICPLLAKTSTTNTIRKIKNLSDWTKDEF
jgi:rfaE bifunctional protein nucleotidyltransferase chain/domain